MSHHVLVAYYSHAGHTARIARTIMETIVAEGHGCDMVDMMEGVREGCGLGEIRHRDRGFSHRVRRLQQDRLGILLDVQKRNRVASQQLLQRDGRRPFARKRQRPKATVTCRSSSSAAPGSPVT